MKFACHFDPRSRRWRSAKGQFVRANRGRRRSSRLDRALELAAFRHVLAIDDGFLVSSADGHHLYRVRLEDRACDCADAMFRPGVRCKHLLAVALRERCLAGLLRDAP